MVNTSNLFLSFSLALENVFTEFYFDSIYKLRRTVRGSDFQNNTTRSLIDLKALDVK